MDEYNYHGFEVGDVVEITEKYVNRTGAGTYAGEIGVVVFREFGDLGVEFEASHKDREDLYGHGARHRCLWIRPDPECGYIHHAADDKIEVSDIEITELLEGW